ncbi:HPF/RaiA family ribosome-associated protein [Yinghuangia seranimata]|uniref:HPF/RaiA family ribosome-associated protein n=1 Tax=Yinghuangia seranimata TaxID=408067 RepID=UPI00248BB533|nr:HPF/RaiA family ribosome-associated protein [Yinghuangia seranimata]MDI2124786.1 HPF/RaiA family ribosome-associated protein [Yinghuangia seranimata]
MKNRSTPVVVPEIKVEAQGDLPRGADEYARGKIAALLESVREPVLFARVRLTQTRNPATERPAVAQAGVDVNGRQARAQVAAATMTEAVDLLQDRLARQLDRLRQDWQARRGTLPKPGPGQWRHGAEPAHRPDHFPRPAHEREVVRHKSYSLARETPDEAGFEMETMGYGFHLFTDLATGEDSVVYRTGPTGWRLAQVHPQPDRLGPTAVPMTVSPQAPPRLDVAGAKVRLEETGQPFVFFVDTTTGRGNVLYHRYDGHYGLITPAD